LGEGDSKMAEITIKEGEVYVDGEKLENRKDLTLKSPRFYMLDGSNKFEDFLNLEGIKDFKESFRSFKWNDSDIFILKADSMKIGALDWDDSSGIFRIKDRFSSKFRFKNGDSKRMTHDFKKQSERMRENMKQLNEEARRFHRENSERIRKDAERIRQDAQRLSREYSQVYKENTQKFRTEMREKNAKWRAEMEVELRKDGILKEGEKMKQFEIGGLTMKVNGEKIPKELRDKYQALFENYWGKKGIGKFYFNFSHDRSDD
jgi:hypothetical protein